MVCQRTVLDQLTKLAGMLSGAAACTRIHLAPAAIGLDVQGGLCRLRGVASIAHICQGEGVPLRARGCRHLDEAEAVGLQLGLLQPHAPRPLNRCTIMLWCLSTCSATWQAAGVSAKHSAAACQGRRNGHKKSVCSMSDGSKAADK